MSMLELCHADDEALASALLRLGLRHLLMGTRGVSTALQGQSAPWAEGEAAVRSNLENCAPWGAVRLAKLTSVLVGKAKKK